MKGLRYVPIAGLYKNHTKESEAISVTLETAYSAKADRVLTNALDTRLSEPIETITIRKESPQFQKAELNGARLKPPQAMIAIAPPITSVSI